MSIPILIVHTARQLLHRASREIADERQGLSESEVVHLLTIYHMSGLTLIELASLLARDKTTVSRGVAKLVGDGLVRTEIDSLDGRRKDLYLTEAGRVLTERAANRIQEDMEQAMLSTAPEDLTLCIRLLETLADMD